jgi:hypothetical protein
MEEEYEKGLVGDGIEEEIGEVEMDSGRIHDE